MIPKIILLEEKNKSDKIKIVKNPHLELLKAIKRTKNGIYYNKNYNFNINDFDEEGNIKK